MVVIRLMVTALRISIRFCYVPGAFVWASGIFLADDLIL